MSKKSIAAIFLALSLGTVSAFAQAIWAGLGLTDGNINEPLNWLLLPPSSGDSVLFGSTIGRNHVLVSTITLGDLTFDASRPVYTLSGTGTTPVLTLNGNVSVANAAPVVTFDNTLALTLAAGATDHVFNVTGASTVMEIDGIIGGNGHFSKTGAGTLILTGANTFNYNGGGSFTNSSAINAGTVQVKGGTINHGTSGDVTIGDVNGDNGTLLITNGGTVSDHFGVIGQSGGSAGTVTVDGLGSSWTNAGVLNVGYQGTGVLHISNHGNVTVTDITTIADIAGSHGTVTVDGGGSSFINSTYLYVGAAGTGSLTITNGGAVSSPNTSIGNNTGGIGTVTVSGTNSSLTNSSTLYVGSAGNGTLIVNSGGRVTNNQGEIGNNPGGTGTAIITGTGSIWSSQFTDVGLSTTGSLSVASGGSFAGNVMSIGRLSGVTGTVTVDGIGSSMALSGNLLLGNEGTGLLTVSGGAAASDFGSSLGFVAGSSGTATVTGAGSTWTNADNLFVGDLAIGVLNIASGGTVTTNGLGRIGNNAGANGTVIANGSGSSWTNAHELVVGNQGTGSLTISNAATVRSTAGFIGNGSTGSGTVTVDGVGSAWNTTTDHIWVGYSGQGTLNVTNGGSVTSLYSTLGYQPGSSGTLNVSGAGSSFGVTHEFVVGIHGTLLVSSGGGVSTEFGDVDGTAATATITGAGSAWNNTLDFRVGYQGQGSLLLSNGGAVHTGGGFIGTLGSSNGSAVIDGAGSIWTNVSGMYVSYSATGSLTLSNGGTVAVNSGAGTVTLALNALGNGTLNIGAAAAGPAAAGGFVNAATITTGTGNGTLQFDTNAASATPYYLTKNGTSGGTAVTITGPTKVINTGGYNVLPGASTYTGSTTITGGTLVAGNNSAFGSSTVTLNGGTLNVASGISFGNTLNLTVNGGTLAGNGTFTSPLTLGSTVTIAPGNSPGTLHFASGLTLNNGITTDLEIRAPTGSAGTDWDLINVTGTLNLTPLSAGGYTLKVISLALSNSPGAVSGLGSTASWTFASATTLTGFSASKFTIDSSSFTGGGIFAVTQAGNNLVLNFTAVPEPSTCALMALGLGFIGFTVRRKISRC